MPIIRFGHTINNVSLENLESLLRVCKGRILIDLEGTDLEIIYKKSKHGALLYTEDIKDLPEDDRLYIFDLVKQKSFPLLTFILKHNEENLKAVTTSTSGEERTLALVAYHERDAELLDLLLSLDSDVFKA